MKKRHNEEQIIRILREAEAREAPIRVVVLAPLLDGLLVDFSRKM